MNVRTRIQLHDSNISLENSSKYVQLFSILVYFPDLENEDRIMR
jgi:hypothetical protein